MKECFKCRRALPLSDFYRHSRMSDGHLGKCKLCTKKDVRANYKDKRDKYHEYDRSRYRTNPERRMALKALDKKYPLKSWARQATNSAIARGLLNRKPCEVCGNEKSDGHHEDYTKPLEIRWLCRQHHMEAHHPLEDAS